MMDSPWVRFILLLPAPAVMLLIMFHSAMPAQLSRAESAWIVTFLLNRLPFDLSLRTLTFLIRKAAHFTEFFLLGLSLQWGMNRGRRTFLIGTGYAIFDEIHQSFVPGRSCEFRDMCIDAAGILTGMLVVSMLQRWNQKRKNLGKNNTRSGS